MSKVKPMKDGDLLGFGKFSAMKLKDINPGYHIWFLQQWNAEASRPEYVAWIKKNLEPLMEAQAKYQQERMERLRDNVNEEETEDDSK